MKPTLRVTSDKDGTHVRIRMPDGKVYAVSATPGCSQAAVQREVECILIDSKRRATLDCDGYLTVIESYSPSREGLNVFGEDSE